MQHIALTGVISMLGVATINECLKKNISVLAFVRHGSTNASRLSKSDLLEIIECDLDKIRDFVQTTQIKNIDVFYHFGWVYTDNVGRNDTSNNKPLLQEAA